MQRICLSTTVSSTEAAAAYIEGVTAVVKLLSPSSEVVSEVKNGSKDGILSVKTYFSVNTVPKISSSKEGVEYLRHLFDS